MSEFTKGPWLYRPDKYDDWGIIRASSGWIVAKAQGGCLHTEEEFAAHRRNGTDPYLANAHLIAAAPELLEALKLWKCWNEDEEPTGLYFNEVMDRVNAAIAKAEGK